jgi:hypothetical protein
MKRGRSGFSLAAPSKRTCRYADGGGSAAISIPVMGTTPRGWCGAQGGAPAAAVGHDCTGAHIVCRCCIDASPLPVPLPSPLPPTLPPPLPPTLPPPLPPPLPAPLPPPLPLLPPRLPPPPHGDSCVLSGAEIARTTDAGSHGAGDFLSAPMELEMPETVRAMGDGGGGCCAAWWWCARVDAAAASPRACERERVSEKKGERERESVSEQCVCVCVCAHLRQHVLQHLRGVDPGVP